ncbi:MAG: flagellar filament capping protein FliD [Peptococcaceae bacterium]|nr:flagellar filament capping protein FliD [Peptococcaceae bacterium]
MNISSSNYYSVSASSSNGISGLISGMDTDSMVKQMLSGTQSKIDKQEALKTQTEWKQEYYRDIINSINGLSSKYFDSTYDSSLNVNFASNAFFNSMISSVTSGDALRLVSTGSSAAAGETRVAVKQLATNSSLVSAAPMSGDEKISGKALSEAALKTNLEKKVVVKVGAQEVSVNLNNVNTEDGLVEAFQQAFQAAGVTGVSAKIYNDRLRLVTEDQSVNVSLGTGSTALGLEMTGLSYASASQIKDIDGNTIGNMLQGGQVQEAAGTTFNLTLDGVQKTITLNAAADSSGNITVDSVYAALQTEVSRAFGDYVTVNMIDVDGGKAFELGLNMNGEKGHQLTVTGISCANIGLVAGDTTHLTTSTKLGELDAGGKRYAFTINGVSFSFTDQDSIGTMINTINNSSAGVKLTYSSLSDTFRLESASTGSKYKIQLSQEEGDLLGTIFGSGKVAAAGAAASEELTVGSIQGQSLAADYSSEEVSLTMTVNGKTYIYSAAAGSDDEALTKAQIENGFQQYLKANFGDDISYADGKLTIAQGYVVKFDQTKVDLEDAQAMAEASKSDLALALGFSRTAASNVAKADTPLSEIQQLQGLDLRNSGGTAAASLEDIATINGHNITYKDGRLVLSGSGSIDLSGEPELAALFGSDSLTLGSGALQTDAVSGGTDAIVIVNGVETTRSSNSFTIDGITMELKKTSAEIIKDGVVTGYEETVIGTGRDVDKIVEGIKSFIEDYNAMLDKLNGYVNEDANYRDYAPLTDEQKDEMSETEIERWEEKAKQGLLRRDSNVESFLSQMRLALYTKPAGAKYALYDLGIETTEWQNKGKLQLDETALRNAISADPDAVRTLFTDAQEGLAKKLTTIMDSAAKISAGSPGTLVQLAGVEGTSSASSNTLSTRITNIESRIKELKNKYEKEKTRYWNQFNTMEQVLANYSSQSSFISQQFSSY